MVVSILVCLCLDFFFFFSFLVGDEKFITKVCGTLGLFFSLGRGGEGRGAGGFLIIIKVCGTFGSEGKIMISNSTCGDGVVVSSEPPSLSIATFVGARIA